MSAKVDHLRTVLRKDKRYKRLKNSFDTSDLYQIPFDEYKQEIRNLHKMRLIHKLSISSPVFAKSLGEAAIKDTTLRHRYTEILSIASEAHHTLSNVLESFEAYFLIKYSHELVSLRTKEERKNFIKAVMNTMNTYLEDTANLIKFTKIHIEDIDKAGYVIKNLVDAYALIAKRDYTNIS